MIKPVLIALLSMPLLAMPPAHGQSADDALFEQANAAFERADYASARAGWETLANKGQSRAMWKLGWAYINAPASWGLDNAKGILWYEKCIQAGEKQCAFNLGWELASGARLPKDIARGLGYYRKAAGMGHAMAMTNIGWHHENGIGVAKDPRQAVDWYRKGAEAGDVIGMANLGNMYRLGYGIAKDDALARQWLQKAAGNGNEAAKSNLALLPPPAPAAATAPAIAPAAKVAATAPPPVPPVPAGPGAAEYQQAHALLEQAIQAVKDVGKIQFGFGKGDERLAREKQEYSAVADRAIPLLDKAVALGNQDAMKTYRSAYCGGYAIGNLNFVAADPAKCRDMSLKLAATGDTEAMLALGRLARKEGPSRDLDAARQWFEKAEAAGNKRAYVELGDLYLPRWKLLSDLDKARYWYARGAEKGDSYSREKLDHYFPQKAVLTAAQQDFIALIESIGPDRSDPHKFSTDVAVYCQLGGAQCNRLRGQSERFYEASNTRALQENLQRIRNQYRTTPEESRRFDARTKCLQERSESIRRATYGQQDWYYDSKC